MLASSEAGKLVMLHVFISGVKTNETFAPAMPYGRGRGQPTLPGLGRGMASLKNMSSVGSTLAPPPGFAPSFVVPNVNLAKNGVGKLLTFLSSRHD